MSNVYISIPESHDLIKNLSTQEYLLYTTVKGMVMENPSANELKNTPLASRLGFNERAVSNAKASLKKKGYLVITFSKDGDGELVAQVYLGKDQVELYNLGLKVEITNARAYRKLSKEFPFMDSNLSIDDRKKLVEQANEAYRNNPEQYS